MSHVHDVVAMIKANHSRKIPFLSIKNSKNDRRFDDSYTYLDYRCGTSISKQQASEAFKKATNLTKLLNSKDENKNI